MPPSFLAVVALEGYTEPIIGDVAGPPRPFYFANLHQKTASPVDYALCPYLEISAAQRQCPGSRWVSYYQMTTADSSFVYLDMG